MKNHLYFSYRWCLLGMFFSSSWMAAQEIGSMDYGRKIEVDRDGNVIVAGETDDGTKRENILIIKYSGAGVPFWTNRFNAPTNSNYKISGLAVDNSGNVFVTGSSSFSGIGHNSHYATIAYSPAGVAFWTNRYDGPGDDVARALAVDHNGNVFVTGSSTREGGYSDYATIAYSGAGVALWTNRYGPGNSHNGARALAVDRNGNVFVTGSSWGSDSGYDYATVAYSASGVALWTNRYNGSGGNLDDHPSAIAVDRSGNVFVTGYSGNDYATIGYSPRGLILWTTRYNGLHSLEDLASALTVDPNGNVFVTGYSKKVDSTNGVNADYTTIAYSGAGVALWTRFHAGRGSGNDTSYAIAVDNSGNVLVTGTSAADYVTIKYSGAGVALWTNRFDGSTNSPDGAYDVAVDSNGNVFVTGYASADCVTIGYSAAGVALWTNRYAGPVNVRQPQLAIQPLTVGASTVNLTLSGPTNSSWSIQRALKVTGPWTNLGLSLIRTNGLEIFRDANSPPGGAFYRITPP